MMGQNECSLFIFGQRAHFLCCKEGNQMHATNHFCVVNEKKKKKKTSKGELWASELSGVFKVKVNSFQPLQARHGVISANTGIGGAIL